MEENNLSRNSIAFIAMTNEYCQEIETVLEKEKDEFVTKMLKLLPRLYVAASDVTDRENEEDSFYIDSYLYEDAYNSVRDNIYHVLGEDDVYLEVFEEDMKYSDTPIATTISENLADLYQEFYNFVVSIQNTPIEVAPEIVLAVKDNFKTYWGQTLVNVMRALHSVKYNIVSD